jgi:hypothetical protein
LPGLGKLKTKTKEEVAADAAPIAVEFAGYNRNGNLDATFVDDDRDVLFGKANFDPLVRDDGSAGCGCYVRTPSDDDPEYYNYVEVRTLRNQAGSGDGDGPLPLFFARIFGMDEKTMFATATAAILPANGFRVDEGSDDTADVLPFAFKEELWERFERAQEYYDDNPGVFSQNWNELQNIDDVNGPYPTEPLFGALEGSGQAVQLFYDGYTRTDAAAVTSGADGKLEVNIYPRNLKFGGEPTSRSILGTPTTRRMT